MTGDHFMATLCRLDVFLLFTFLNIISNSRSQIADLITRQTILLPTIVLTAIFQTIMILIGTLLAVVKAMTTTMKKVVGISLNVRIHGIKEMTVTTLAMMTTVVAWATVVVWVPMAVI